MKNTQNNYVVPEVTLNALRDLFFQNMRYRSFSEATIASTARNMRIFYAFLKLKGIEDIQRITSEEIEEYKEYLNKKEYVNNKGEIKKYSKRYIVDQLITVKQFFKYLISEDVVITNPVEEVKIPEVPDEIPRGIMTEKELKKVLSMPDISTPEGYRDRTILEILYATGIRNSELCNLKTSNVDFDNLLLKVVEGKGRKDRIVPVSFACIRFVRRYVKEFRPVLLMRKSKKVTRTPNDGTLFVGNWGAKLDPDRIETIVKRYVKKAKLTKHITPHSFRHTIATHLLKNGMDIRYVQELLGHSSINTTQRYTRVDVRQLREKMERAKPVRHKVPEAQRHKGERK